MSKDIVDIRLSKKASDVANRFVNELHFPTAIAAAKFGFAYMLRKSKEEEILGWFMLSDKKRDDRFDTSGYNYAGASIDQGGRMAKLIQFKFPDCDTPYLYIRLLMDAGLCELGDEISSFEDLLTFLKNQKF